MQTTKALIKEGRIWWQGVDYGPRAKLINKNDNYMVIRVPGHTFASGQLRPYAPSAMFVFEVISEEPWRDGGVQYTLKEVIEWELSKKANHHA